MTPAVFAAVLFAAALHATWNAIVKTGDDTILTTVLVTASASIIALIGLPFLPSPSPASWLFIAASTVLQVVYFVLVAHAYRIADMSVAYPVMRGSAPLLVALASAGWIGEDLSATAWLGVGVICLGILSIAAGIRHRTNSAGLRLALANAVVIASYTLIDGIGVRRSGAPAAYTLWIFLLTGVSLSGWTVAGWTLAGSREVFSRYVRRNWYFGLIGGAGTVSSYGIALWAMTTAPVAVVAALRETSILFGIAISGILLHERLGPTRIIAVCAIAFGAVVLRLS
jgi:drug/metabolite transporter (DMT)-like permease